MSLSLIEELQEIGPLPMVTFRVFPNFARLVAAFTLLALFFSTPAMATNLYWDTNGNTAGSSNSTTGVWGTSNFWSTSAAGTGSTFQTATTGADDLTISAGSNATGANTITISGTELAQSLTLAYGTVTLAGAATPVLTLGTGGLTMNNTLNGTLTINSTLTDVILAGSQSWTNGSVRALSSSSGTTIKGNATAGNNVLWTLAGNGGGASTFSGVISDGANGGSLAVLKSGTNTVTFSGANTYTGSTSVTGGTLRAGSTVSAFGSNSAVSLSNSTGVFLDLNGNNNTIGSLSGGGVTGGSVILGAGTLTTGGDNTNTTFGGIVSGAGGLTFSGAGKLTLTNTNTFTGRTTISAGTLQIGSGANDGRLTGNVTNNAALIFASSSDSSFAGGIYGTGTLTKNNAGNLTLTGSSTYSGGTTINGGSIIAGGTSLGSGLVTVNSSGTLSTGASSGLTARYYLPSTTPTTANFATLTALQSYIATMSPVLTTTAWTMNVGTTATAFPSPVNVSGTLFSSYYSGKINIASAGSYSFSVNSDDGGMLWVDGSNVVDNNGGHAMTLKSGTVNLTSGLHDIAIGHYNSAGGYGLQVKISGVNNFTMVDLNAANAQLYPDLVIGSLAGAGAVILDDKSGISIGTDGTNSSFSGSITGSSSLSKVGSGVLTLSGNNTSYSGTSFLGGGTLALANTNPLGTSGTITFSGGTMQFATAASAQDYGTRIANSGSQIMIDTAGRNVSFGTLAASNTAGLTKLGAGTLTLTGSNAMTATVTISNGALRLGNGTNDGTLTSNQIVNNGSLLVNAAGTQILNGSISGTGSLGKSGAGSLFVLGGSNAYSGDTNVTAGSLYFGGRALGTGTANVTTGAFLMAGQPTGFSARYSPMFTSSGSTYGAQSNLSTWLGYCASFTPYLETGAPKLDYSTYTYFPAPYGTYPQSGTHNWSAHYYGRAYITTAGSYTISAAADDYATVWVDGTAVLTNITYAAGTVSSAVSLTSGLHDINVAYGEGSGGFYLKVQVSGPDTGGSTVYFGDPSIPVYADSYIGTLQGAGVVSVGTVTGLGLNVGQSNVDSTYSGNISGIENFTKSGTGTLSLSGNNVYSGTTYISAGTLNLGSANALNGGGTIRFSGGTLQFSVGNASDYSARITGNTSVLSVINLDTNGRNVSMGAIAASNTSGLSKYGAGILNLTGSNGYTGTTTIAGGTLRLSHLNALAGGGSVTFAGGTLQFGVANGNYSNPKVSSTALITIDTGIFSGTWSGSIASSNTAGLMKLGAGSLTLTGSNNTYTGGTTISAGTIIFGGRSLSTGNVDVSSGGTLISGLQVGLAAEYYSGVTIASGNLANLATWKAHLATLTPSIYTTTPTLNMGTSGAGFPSGYTTNFEAHYYGKLNVGTAGNYSISKFSDDGCMVWVDGAYVVGTTGYTAATSSGTVALSAGLHDINVGYQEGSGGYGMVIQISPVNSLASYSDLNTANAQIFCDSYVGSLSGAGNVIANASTLGYGINLNENHGDTTFSGAISGAGVVTKSGTGTLTLSGNNTYSGSSVLAQGTLSLASVTALPSGGTIKFTGGTLQFSSSNTLDYGSVVKFSDMPIALDTNSQGVSLGALASSNTGGLSKLGVGTLTLTGSNAFTGTATLYAGTLALANSNALAGGGSLTFAGGTLQYSSANTTDYSSRIIASTLGAIALDTNGQGVSYAGNLSVSNTAGLIKVGAGTLTLSGSNSYTGVTTLSGGTLKLNSVNALAGMGSLTFSGGTLLYGTGITTDVSSRIFNSIVGPITVDTNGQLVSYTSSIDSSNTSGLTKLGAGTLALTGLNAFSGTVNVFAGTLSVSSVSNVGLSDGGLGNSGAGVTVNLGNAGGVTGTLEYTGSSANSTKPFVLATGGTGAFQIDSSSAQLNLTGVISGSGDFQKTGVGTIKLGGLNTYTGATNVNSGTLLIGNANGLSSTSVVNVTPGKGFGYAGSTDAQLTINGNLNFAGGAGAALGVSLGSGTSTAMINVTGAAIASAGGYSINFYGITGVQPVDGTYTLITGGPGSDLSATANKGNIYNNSNFFIIGGIVASTYTLTAQVQGTAALTNAYWRGGLPGATNQWAASNGVDNSNWVASLGGGTQSLSPGITTQLHFSDTTVTTTPNGSTLGSDMSVLGVSIEDTARYVNLNADGSVLTVGSNGITISGTALGGTLAADIAAGTLQTWANYGTNPFLVSGRVDTGGYKVTLAGSGGDITLSGIVFGSGGLTKTNSGTLSLSGNNTFTGTTAVTTGTLSLNSSGALGGNGDLTLTGGMIQLGTSNATFASKITGSTVGVVLDTGVNNGTWSGNIDGTNAGGLTKIGSGVLTLSGSNGYGGTTAINAGTIKLNSANALAGGGSVTFGGGTLQFTSSNTADLSSRLLSSTSAIALDTNNLAVAISGNIGASNTGGLTKLGSGTLMLLGNNTYAGTTTIAGGTLNLSSTTALAGGGNVTFKGGTFQLGASGATFTSGVVNSTSAMLFDTNGYSATLSGDVAASNNAGLVKMGTGTLTLSGNNAYSGTSTVSFGTLNVGSATALGAGSIALQGGTLQFGVSGITLTNRIAYGGTNVILLDAGGSTNSNTISGNITSSNTGGLTMVGQGTITLSGSNGYTGTTTLYAGTLVSGTTNALAVGTLVIGGTGSSVGNLDLSNFSQTVTTLRLANNGSSTSGNITIGSGKTLTATGAVTIGDGGAVNSLTDSGLTMTGGGTFSVAATGTTFRVGNSSSGTYKASLDLTGLSNVVINTGAGGAVNIQTSSGTSFGAFSSLLLPTTGGANSTITSATMNVGTGSQGNGNASVINSVIFGSGTNTLNLTTLNIGAGNQDSGSLSFGSNGSGTLVIRDLAGTGRAAFNMGTGTNNQSQMGTNTFDVSGHSADLLLGAVSIGTNSRQNVTSTNTFNFSQGTLDMTSLTMGLRGPGAFGNSYKSTSTMNLSGGTITIGSGILQLGSISSGIGIYTSHTAAATLNVTGGSVTIGATSGTAVLMASSVASNTATGAINISGGTVGIGGNILKGGGAGTTTAVITLSGGTLNMGSYGIGTSANNVSVTGSAGWLMNVGSINGGTSAWTKAGTGTLYLAGSNLSMGTANLTAGTMQLASSGAINGSSSLKFTGGTLQFGVSAGTYAALVLSSTSAIAVDTNGFDGTLSGNFASSNTAGLTKMGAGMLVISGSNGYTGVTNILSGTLNLGGSNALSGGGSLTFSGGTLQLGISGGSYTTGAVNSTSSMFIDTNGYGVSFSGNWDGTNVAGLTKLGSGSLTLSGSNGFTGVTTLNAGTLILGGTYSLAGNGAVTFAGGTLALGINGGTYTNAITGSGASGLLFDSNSYTGFWSGNMDATNTGALTKMGSGLLTLSGSNGYTGTTLINVGTLGLGSTYAVGGGGNITFGGGTLLFTSANTSDVASRIVSSGSAIVIDTNAQGVTFSNGLSATNTGGLVKVGSGTLIFGGNNLYTGTTNVNGGTLSLNSSTALAGGGNIQFGGGTLQFTTNNANDYGSKIVGSGSAIVIDTNAQGVSFSTSLASSNVGGLTKLGAGTLTLSGSNSYTGVTTVSAGTLSLGSANALAGGGSFTLAGGTLQFGTNAANYSNKFANSLGAMLIDSNGLSSTLSGNLLSSNTGGLTKLGVGTLILSGSNGYTGTTTISAGTIQIGSTTALAGSGSLTFTGGLLQLGLDAGTFTSAIVNSTSAIAIDTNGYSAAISGNLAASNISGLTKLGGGTLVLSGSNAYTGTTTINGGTLQLASVNAFAGGGSLTFTGGMLQLGVNVGTLSSVIANSTSSMAIDTNGYNVAISGNLAASNAGGLAKSGSGTLTLSGSNSFTSLSSVAGGTLKLDSTNALAGGGALAFAGGTLQFGLTNATYMNGISGSGASVIQIDTGILNGTLSGIADNTNTGGLTKMGTGILTLSGNNSYTGTTNVNGGTINLGHANALSTSGAITFGGGTLQFTSSNTTDYGNRIAGSTGAIALDTNSNDVTFAGDITSSNMGGLRKFGVGSLTLSGSNGYTGTTYIDAGTLSLGHANALAGNGNITFRGGTLQFTVSNQGDYSSRIVNSSGVLLLDTNAQDVTFAGDLAASNVAGLTKLGAGKLTLSGNNASTGVVTLGAGTVSVTSINNGGVAGGLGAASNAGSNLIFAGGTLQYGGATASTDRSFTINAGSNAFIDVLANTLTISGTVATTTGGVVKNGAGALVFAGSNDYTGATVVNAGSLSAGVSVRAFGNNSAVTLANTAGVLLNITGFDNTIGSLAGGGVTGGNVELGSATLTLGADGTSTTYSGVLSGAGGVTKTGAGTQIFAGANIYTGLTTVNVGTLKAGVTTSAFGVNAQVSLANTAGALLDITGFDTSVGSLTGGGATGGNVELGSAILTLGGDNLNATYSGALSGAGGITKTGTGTQTLGGASVYTGATTVNGGSLKAGVATVSFSVNSAVTLADTAGVLLDITGYNTAIGSLAGGGSSGGNVELGSATLTVGSLGTSTTYSGVLSGAGGLNKFGSGVLTLSGSNTYTGATVITEGSLRAGVSGQAFGVNSAVQLSNASGVLMDLGGNDTSIGSLAGGGASGGNVELGSGRLTVGGDGMSTSFGGIISGAGGVTKTGSGVLTLSGA
ncbi:MAG: autotransporter-associated beta strand repeat-containing protein, partial [Verrucomicrobiota bacterium]